MEFHFTHYLAIFFVLFFASELIKKYSKRKVQKFPPGPWKLPIIGSMHHMSGGLPHQTLRNLAKKYGPIMHIQLGEVHNIVISSAEMAKEVLKNHDVSFATRMEPLTAKIMLYGKGGLAFSPYGEYWRQVRKICIVELLSGKHVRSFCSIREDEANRLINSIRASSGQPVNVTELLLAFTSSVVCRAAFGKRHKGQDTLIEMMKHSLAMAGGFDVSDLFPSKKLLHVLSGMKPRLIQIHQNVDRVLENLIEEHQKSVANGKRGDGESDEEHLIDVLLRVKETGECGFPITMDNVKSVIFDIFGAGTETSSTTSVWAMAELMRCPRALKKAQAELRQAFKGKTKIEENDIQGLKYLKMVVKETLRLHPALPIAPRACREQCAINGYTIPDNTRVMVNLWAIGRDPNYWKDAEAFIPERFDESSIDYFGSNFEFIPFGSGRRICPGMTFGVQNIEVLLAQLLYHFDWEIPGGINPEELDMNENPGLTCSRKGDLLLYATPYDP